MSAQLSFLTPDCELDAARVAAQAGIDQALSHAEEETPDWGALALSFLRDYARKEREFAAYMLVMASELDRQFPVPPSTKAWGQVFREGAKLGLIENSGRTTPHPRRHACPTIVWTSLIFGRAI